MWVGVKTLNSPRQSVGSPRMWVGVMTHYSPKQSVGSPRMWVGCCNEISGFMVVKKCFEIVRTILFEQKPLMGKGEF